ncbi:MAG: hypothetical protein EOO08_15065 [Chitinophagaceae bacterium]|nr:MAG: hypothetical protein EOO08_15065 [Chitinophagaceae bacterium]
MKPKSALTDYFTFSKKDRLAIVLFLAVVAGLLAVPALLPPRAPAFAPLPDSLLRRPGATNKEYAEETKERPQWDPYEHRAPADRDAWRSAPLFPFDPNELDAAGWKKLGLTDRAVGTLVKYRERGGRFRKPEDLEKIWSLPARFVDRVLPYVRIGEAGAARTVAYPAGGARAAFPSERPAPALLSINEADSAAWERLPGIGAKLAARIVRYRERLGGFASVDQVAEVWGVPDSTFRALQAKLQLKSNGPGVRKINLNTASKEEMKNHPYIRWNLANVLFAYRQQHGLFHSFEELRKIEILPDSTWKKLAPYITFD